MSDILSQEEIDKLLNAAASGSVTGEPDKGGPISPEAMGAATKIANIILSAANSALGTMVAKPCEVSDGLATYGELSDFDNKKNVAVKARFRSGFTGEVAFVLDVKSAATLADLILGGEGEGKNDLAEGDDDAVKEMFGTVFGNAAPSLTGATGVEIGFDSPLLKVCAPGALESALGKGSVFASRAKLKVEGVLDSYLRVVMTGATANSIAESLDTVMEEEEHEPPRPAPVAAPVEPYGARAAPAPARRQPSQIPPEIRNIDLILDIEVEVMVRLGNAQMPLRDIQKLKPGSIIDLDRDTDALVELVVNDRVIAKGELVVVSSDHFALRVTEIVTQTERIKSLGGE